MKIDELIEKTGGTLEIASLCGIGASTVSNWKARNSIPRQYWGALIEAARERGIRGITAEKLLSIHSEHERVAP